MLQNRNRVVLKNIGEISVNNEMNWVFEPANTVNYLTESFGLSPFVSPEITRSFKTRSRGFRRKSSYYFYS